MLLSSKPVFALRPGGTYLPTGAGEAPGPAASPPSSRVPLEEDSSSLSSCPEDGGSDEEEVAEE